MAPWVIFRIFFEDSLVYVNEYWDRVSLAARELYM
jgi:hypothetical protein